MPFIIVLIIWCVAGTIFFFKTFEDVQKVLKMILLIVVCGPVIWVLAIAGVILQFLFETLPNWFKN